VELWQNNACNLRTCNISSSSTSSSSIIIIIIIIIITISSNSNSISNIHILLQYIIISELVKVRVRCKWKNFYK